MTLKEIERNIQELAAEMAMSIIKHMGVTVTIAGMLVDIDNIEKEIDGIKVEINTPICVDGNEYDLVKVKSQPIEEEEDTTSLDLDGLKILLNGYVKQVGKEKAFDLVKQYANGSKKAADIPKENYIDIIKAVEGIELAIDGEAA